MKIRNVVEIEDTFSAIEISDDHMCFEFLYPYVNIPSVESGIDKLKKAHEDDTILLVVRPELHNIEVYFFLEEGSGLFPCGYYVSDVQDPRFGFVLGRETLGELIEAVTIPRTDNEYRSPNGTFSLELSMDKDKWGKYIMLDMEYNIED